MYCSDSMIYIKFVPIKDTLKHTTKIMLANGAN